MAFYLVYSIIFLILLQFQLADQDYDYDFDYDECLYSNQMKKDCIKNKMNTLNESCCYLEMELNQISTSACVRVKKDKKIIEQKIKSIKKAELNYELENIIIDCSSITISADKALLFLIFFFILF